MKVVLDTNVLVSAAMTSRGTCSRILDLLADGLFAICADDRILDEYETVLHEREFRIVAHDAAIVLELVRAATEPVAGVPLSTELPDPRDLPFLEVAAAAEAILVTGNIRHFPKRARAGVTVVRPAEFLELIRQSS